MVFPIEKLEEWLQSNIELYERQEANARELSSYTTAIEARAMQRALRDMQDEIKYLKAAEKADEEEK